MRSLRTGATALVLAATGLLPAAPAEAHPITCTFTGSVTFSAGLYVTTSPPTVAAWVSASVTGGVSCTISWTGIIVGNCDNWSASGTVVDDQGAHDFSMTSAGYTWVSSGGVTGAGHMYPAPGESCLPGGPGADTFLFTGSIVTT